MAESKTGKRKLSLELLARERVKRRNTGRGRKEMEERDFGGERREGGSKALEKTWDNREGA